MRQPVVEEVLSFRCGESTLWGVLSRPAAPASTAVVIVVGGPQYRAGSHRQFVHLARHCAGQGVPSLRFDYRGMGDSEGELRNFEHVGPDIAAALDAVCRACPGVRRVVVWGLCDAASAALMFAASDPRVAGMVIANPWVRSEASLAAAQVKHYYRDRLLQREFWAKLLRGGLDWRGSARALAQALRRARDHARGDARDGASFQSAMARGLSRFRGHVLLLLSGNDLTAQEFLQCAAVDPAWRGLLDDPKLTRIDLSEADHTFSTRAWRATVEHATIEWMAKHGLAPASSEQAAA